MTQQRVQRAVSPADRNSAEKPASPFASRPFFAAEAEPKTEPRSEGRPWGRPGEVPENRTGLPDGLKAGIESLSGLSIDDVQVHYNSPRPAQLKALAYTQGVAIHVAPGQERHLAHEAWHVVQQKQRRVTPTLHLGGTAVNDDPALEQEADAMGRQAASDPPQPAADPGLRTEPVSGPSVAQRKMGVEYETKWTIDSSSQERSANHKKKVYQGVGYYIESDNNDLEFVSFPPSETAQDLYTTVGLMQTMAVGMTGRVRGRGPEPQPPFLKRTVAKLLQGQGLSGSSFTLESLLKDLVREEDREEVSSAHAAQLAEKLKTEGWTVPKGETTAEAIQNQGWSKEDISAIKVEDLPFQIEPIGVRDWQHSNDLATLLGGSPTDRFTDKQVLVEEGDKEMPARPQFTFGVELSKIPQLFQMFIQGPTGDNQEQTALHFRKNPETLDSYGREHIGKRLKDSDDKATNIFATQSSAHLDEKSLGLIRYLIFYLDQMRTKEFTSNTVLKAATRATHVGQELLASLKPEEAQTFPIDSDKLDAALKHVELEEADEAEIKRAFGDDVAGLKAQGSLTSQQRKKVGEYVEEKIELMMADPVYPKHFFVLMNRSGFDRMYDSLDSTQKGHVNKYVEENVLPKYLKETQQDVSLFKYPYYFKKKTGADQYQRGVSYGPTLKQWWESIKSEGGRQQIAGTNLTDEQTKRDKMSPPAEFIDHEGKPDETQALGALNKMDENLGVIELREWGQEVPAKEWQTHTADMLKAFVHKILGSKFTPQ